MTRFTAYQYDLAIKHLQEAKTQLEPDGNCCAVCGDSGHMAFGCGFNPLVAMAICKGIADEAYKGHDELHKEADEENTDPIIDKFHNLLHWLAGLEIHMGEQCGPAKVIMPPVSKETDPNEK